MEDATQAGRALSHADRAAGFDPVPPTPPSEPRRAPIQIVRDLAALRVLVIHQPDQDGVDLVEHLRRLGCDVATSWPIPEQADSADVIVLAIDHASRASIRQLCRGFERVMPTMIAVVGSEDPSILQLVLDAGVHAVIERPVRPIGLLTQLSVARGLWLERQQAARQLQKVERKLAGLRYIQRAKSILMSAHGLTEDEAHQTIRRKAMSKRMPIEELALAIINAHEVLNSVPKPP